MTNNAEDERKRIRLEYERKLRADHPEAAESDIAFCMWMHDKLARAWRAEGKTWLGAE